MSGDDFHVPVLVDEVLETMAFGPGQFVIDGTVGGGGHLDAIRDRLGDDGRILGLDLDPAALAATRERVGDDPRVTLRHGSFADLDAIAAEAAPGGVDRILLDLGVSTAQLTGDRFSFRGDAALDFRLNPDAGETAADLLATRSEQELADLIFELGEERFARRIARRVVEARRTKKIDTAGELVELIRQAYPAKARHGRTHLATRTFQALRLAVNDMMGALSRALEVGPALLKPAGRIGVIAFHSLEDRPVKHAFRELAREPRYTLVTRKPIFASDEEIARNPSARSARLRVLAVAPTVEED